MSGKLDPSSGERGPSEWVSSTIEDIAEAVSTGPFGSLLHKHDYITGGVPVINPVNLVDGLIQQNENVTVSEEAAKRLSAYCVRPGDILVGRRGDIGRCALVSDSNGGWLCGTGCFFVRPSLVVEPRFLALLLGSPEYRERLQASSTGATMLNLSNKTLSKLAIRIPPLEEQKRIVVVLDQAFAALDRARVHAEANLADAQQLVAAAMEQLFPNDQVMTEGRSLGDLCEAIIDCEHKTAPTQDQGIPSIRTPNIGKGVLLLDGANRVSEETYREWTRRAEPQPGDLILAREAPAGNVAVIPEGMRVCLGQRTVLLRPKKDLFVPAYLAHLLLRPSSQARLLAHSRGATVQHINVKDIRAFRISSLPPLPDQGAVVRGVERLIAQGQSLADAYTRRLADLAKIRQSLLQKAFSGELT